jgi:hypothetical protein
MVEKLNESRAKQIEEIWKKGDKLEEEGYGDMAFSLQLCAMEEVLKLNKEDRKKLLDKMFPAK